MKYHQLFKRISFALFMYMKNNRSVFYLLYDKENSNNHKIDVSYKKKVIDITS
jgi:hypothetical protein